MPLEQVTAVVMLKMFGGHYAANQERLELLVASLKHYGPHTFVENLVLVVPDDELARAELFYNGRFRIVSDSQVCPTINNFNATNWVKQQFIKLSFHTVCATPFYLTLDPDNFATRKFTDAAIVSNGRGAMDYTVKSDHSEWWTASADLIQLPHADIPDRVMLVTPCVYSVESMKEMKSSIEMIYSEPWDRVLLDRFHFTDEHPGWIENAIYYLHMIKSGTLQKYHVTDRSEGMPSLHSTSEVWIKEQFRDWDPHECFSENAAGIFSLVQGNTYINPSSVREKIGKFIGLDQ